MSRLFGTKQFYKSVAIIALPIMVQNAITAFVNVLDNIMVGMVGTEQMSGVAITNQLIFVFNLCIFGALGGVGIFTAQFFGAKNSTGVRYTFRFKILSAVVILLVGWFIFSAFGEPLIRLYLHSEEEMNEKVLVCAKQYIHIIIWGLLPFVLSQAYSSTLRECGQTRVPMIASVTAVLVNFVINYTLIFGKFGFPALGVQGAAIGTVTSRFAELAIVAIWTHTHKYNNEFIIGAYKTIKIPFDLAKKIFAKGAPLMINEMLWSVGMALAIQCCSIRGVEVVAGLNISATVSDVFNIVFYALGSTAAIIVGQKLGADRPKEAKQTAVHLLVLTVIVCSITGMVLYACSSLFPQIYNTTAQVKAYATSFIRIVAICTPIMAYMHVAYFVIRSGGKALVVLLLDSCFMWFVAIPTVFCLSKFTNLPIETVYFCYQFVEIFKCIIGTIILKKGIWINNIVKKEEAADV